MEFSSKDPKDNYIEQLYHLENYGDVVDVRGRKTKEILNVMTTIHEPWHHCILIPSRRWNPWLALSEWLWIMAGRNDIAALKPYNQNITEFSDDGFTTYGAYGPRIYDQIDILINRLKKDPSDRRAVLQIWDSFGGFGEEIRFGKESNLSTEFPHQDLWRETKDPPCNNLVYFKLRNNKLHMTVINRSNDIHWGLYAVNIPTFGMLQVYIAARLGVEVGKQQHLSNSLHFYTDDHRAVAITKRMLYSERTAELPIYPSHERILFHRDVANLTHREFGRMCSAILDVDDSPPAIGTKYPLFLAFAAQFLKAYRQKNRASLEAIVTTFPEFRDWTLAGEIFADKMWK